MKLSEMSTEKATECMAAIVPAMRSIMENEGVVKLIAEHRTPADKKEMTDLFFDLMKNKKQEVACILSQLTGKTSADVLHQPFSETVKDITDCIDADLMSFFI